MKSLINWLRNECNLIYNENEILELEELIITNLGLSEIHPEINKMTKLKRLDCSNNNLSAFNIQHPNLIDISCYQNYIIDINLDCPKLSCIFAHQNLIERGKLETPELHDIYLSENQISSININKKAQLHINSNNLEILDLGGNKINEININYPTIKHLDLSDNDIQKIKLDIDNLNELRLSTNYDFFYDKKKTIDSLIILSENLQKLYMRGIAEVKESTILSKSINIPDLKGIIRTSNKKTYQNLKNNLNHSQVEFIQSSDLKNKLF